MRRRKFILNSGAMVASMYTGGMLFGKTGKHDQPFYIEQFKDNGLAHFSYALLADAKIILVDPARDPQSYYDFAASKGAKIIGVIETHPHADFISSHLQLHRDTGATIYASKLVGAAYPHHPFDEGDHMPLSSKVSLRAIHTPGHSPDSISVIVQENGKDVALFSGDALLFGDVGRPDLRAYSGDFATEKRNLARQMYHTIKEKFSHLPDNVVLYPAHGAGSLCANTIRDVNQSTIGYEKANNYAFQERTEEAFVQLLLNDQPHIPKYFPFDVELNKNGAASYKESLADVPLLEKNFKPLSGEIIVDARAAALFKESHIPKAINIVDGGKFETWLGSIVGPEQHFYLVSESEDKLKGLIAKAAKIGYETNIKGAFVFDKQGESGHYEQLDLRSFDGNKGDFLILDVRTEKEVKDDRVFAEGINIPLQELQERIKELPKNKKIVVHCASGYRSAIASSIIGSLLPDVTVYDLGSDVRKYQ